MKILEMFKFKYSKNIALVVDLYPVATTDYVRYQNTYSGTIVSVNRLAFQEHFEPYSEVFCDL